MKKKRPTLTATMQTAGSTKPTPTGPPSRRGKVAWVCYLPPDQARRLKAAAALAGLSLQRAGEQAADDLIARHLPQ